MALSAQQAEHPLRIAQRHKLDIAIWHPNHLAQSEIQATIHALTIQHSESAQFLEKSQTLPDPLHRKPLTHFPTVWLERNTHANAPHVTQPRRSAQIVGIMPDAFWEQSIKKMKRSIACP